jgi:O-Antigen ligase
MEAQIQGYPVAIYYAAATIGALLVLYRPRWAFAFIVFCLAVRNYHVAVFTRTPFLSEFVNFNDLFLWLGVLAVLMSAWHGQRIWFPNILLALIGINLLGTLQSLLQYGFHYEVMQACWGAWVFPIMFAVGVNMVRDKRDAPLFYWALFLGALGAAVQHLFFLQSRIELFGANISNLRNISFSMSGGLFLVLSAFFFNMRRVYKNSYIVPFWIIGLPLIAMSYILSFTRTVWVGATLAVIALMVLIFHERRRMFIRFGYVIFMLVIIVVGFKFTKHFISSNVDLMQTLDQRAEFLKYEDTFEEAYQTREAGLETELDMWKNSTIIWGVGSSYPPSLVSLSEGKSEFALNHVAFSAYLAHFGLIGLLTYGLLLPYFTVKVGRRYFFSHIGDLGGAIALTAMALAFFDLFTLLSGNHYLLFTGQIPGLIYGSLWGLSRSMDFYPVGRPVFNKMINWQQRRWLPGPVKPA